MNEFYDPFNTVWGDAFWATGNIGFYLLGKQLTYDEKTDEEDPRFR